jgi:hypothetical protein
VASLRFDGSYYWRVRTADRSGNLSEWSEVRALNSGTSISGLTINPASVAGGNSAQGQVTLTALAPAGGIVISLGSSDTAVAAVPASVTIPQGGTSATFNVSTRAVSASTALTITGSHGGNTRSATLTVSPSTAPPAAPTLVSPANNIRVPPNASITFTWNAVAGAATYEIQIDDSDRFSAPLTGSQAGLTQAQYAQTFTSERRYWWRVRGRTAGGTNGAWSAVRTFEVRRGAPAPPPPPGPAALSSLSLSPSTVTGGNSSQGTVTLTSAAPSGGALVALPGSNAGVAAAPSSVNVPTGATSAAFDVTTNPVSASTSATISATYGGVTRTTTLTVNAAQAGDSVAIQRAEYTGSNRELRVEATSTNAAAVLTCYVTATGALIGTLTNDGGGRYRGQFTWSSNPQNITVRSSLGGSATMNVTAR